MPRDVTTKHGVPEIPAGYSEEQFNKLIEVIALSQHNHRELIDNLDQAVFTLSLHGEVRVANRRLREMLDVPFPDLIGHHLGEFIASPAWLEIEPHIASFLAKGSWTGVVPVRLKREDSYRYFECWLRAVAEGGTVASATGWARDVTHERDSERFFTDFFQSLREGAFVTTAEGRVLDANPALIRMLGYGSKEELLGHNFRDFHDNPADRDANMRELYAAFPPDSAVERVPLPDRELVLRKKDGGQLYCLGSGFATKDRLSGEIHLQGVLFDITERREIQGKLHKEQEFVRRLVASFPDLIAVLDRDGRFAFVSQRINEFTGIRPEEIVGKPLGYKSDPEDRAKLQEMFDEVISGRSANAQLEFRSRHADGTWRTLRMSASPLFDEFGKISGVVSSARDVTETKQLEQQLAEKEKFASMGQMMAGAAHELNNPLTAILGVSELLRERATDESSRRQLEIILRQARRAASIVQNLLAFARPPAQGRVKVQLETVVRQVLQAQRSLLERKNISVKFEDSGDLPAIEGDSRLLAQVFQNLIANAEQSISAARDHGRITVSLRQAGNEIEVLFADDGPGIPRENMSRIFDPFFTTKRPGGGAGLGLTISLAVLKEHGGSIEVEQGFEGGAAFRVRLPIAQQSPAIGSGTAPSATARSAEAVSFQGHRVLVVDDEESIREIVEEGLRARGMQVDAAENAESALSYFDSNACELVLCDSNLPGLNGEQFFQRVRAKLGKATPPFIFITGDLVDSAAVEKFSQMGARVVQKPFRMAALAAVVAEILQPQPSRVS